MTPFPFTPLVVVPPQWAGWQQLLQAWHCAGGDADAVWQMSVEVSALKDAGLTHTDIRQLVRQGLAELAEETTGTKHHARQLRPLRSLTLGPRTAVALTAPGAAWIEHQLASYQHALAQSLGLRSFAGPSHFTAASFSLSPAQPPAHPLSGNPQPTGVPLSFTSSLAPPPHHPASNQIASAPPLNPLTANLLSQQPAPAPPPKPHWDPARHELRIGDIVVKHFRRPAPTMELILTAFEEENWPSVINDPLPGSNGKDPKRRLHHAVRNLNSMQSPKRIHFHVNGGGEEVHWELVPALRANRAQSTQKRR